MKLGFFTNFTQPFHTGGSEKVVQQISEYMANECNAECFVFSEYGKYKTVLNNVQIIPTGNLTDQAFFNIIQNHKFDHIFVYGDWFLKLDILLKNIDNLKCSFTIVPVGFNRFRSDNIKNQIVRDIFLKNKQKIKIITHSGKYVDAVFCKQNNISFSVISNSINFHEFNLARKNNFRNKYNIKNKNIILYVGNFFPGKGQEHLLKICRNLACRNIDFLMCTISTNSMFSNFRKLHDNFVQQAQLLQLPFLDLIDIDRQDVIDAYIDANIFACASEAEVAPLVILEAMAAKTPWVSMDVGNVNELFGGNIVNARIDADGKRIVDDDVIKQYTDSIYGILTESNLQQKLTDAGYNQIINYYNWDKVKLQYKELFYGKNISDNICI